MVHRLEAQTARRGGQCFVNTVPRPAKAAKANRFDWMLEEQDPVLHWPESGTPVAIIKKPMDRNLPRPRAPEFAYDQRASFHYPLNQRVADRRASPKCPKAPPRTAISFPITAEIIENQSPTQTARKMCECRSSSKGGHY